MNELQKKLMEGVEMYKSVSDGETKLPICYHDNHGGVAMTTNSLIESVLSPHAVTQMLKVGYLALYNAIQWIGFIVLEVILLYLLKDGQGIVYRDEATVACITLCLFSDGISRAYELGFPVIAVFQSLSVLEIVNNLLGLVKGGVAPSILQVNTVIVMWFSCYHGDVFPGQVGVRWFILFVCLYPVEAIHTHPIVYALFMVYSLIELVR